MRSHSMARDDDKVRERKQGGAVWLARKVGRHAGAISVQEGNCSGPVGYGLAPMVGIQG